MDEYLQRASPPFFRALSHRFLCKECLDSDLSNLREYFGSIYNKKESKNLVYDFGVNSLYCCTEKKMKTIQCSCYSYVNTRDGGLRCITMLHYDCYMGFLSLLNHQCRSYFSWQPLCLSCMIIVYLAGVNNAIEVKINYDDQYDTYHTYSNLFLHDYRVPSRINLFDGHSSVPPIPRGVIEHYDLETIPLPTKRKEVSNNLAAKCRNKHKEVEDQERMLRKLRGDDYHDLILKISTGTKDKPVTKPDLLKKCFLFYDDHRKKTDNPNQYLINRCNMGCMCGHDDRQRDRKTKFFYCSDIDILIGPNTHLEMVLDPKDLFELIRSVRGNHLPGRDSWMKISRKFGGEHINETDKKACYTKFNCFKKTPPLWTLYLIHKSLEKRTKTDYKLPSYILVYMKEPYKQQAHVDLSASVFVPHKKIGFIMHLPLCSEGIWLRIWERDGIARLGSKGYLIHIPFGTVLFLRSDIVQSGIYGSSGIIQLHYAFQPIENPGDKSLLLHVDSLQTLHLDIGDLDKVVYARCDHYDDDDDDVAIPVVADQEVEFFKQLNYLRDYIHYAEPRCDDASGYSDPLIYDNKASVSRPKSTSGLATSGNKKSPPSPINNAGLTASVKKEGATMSGYSKKRAKSSSEKKSSRPPKKTEHLSDSDEEYVEKGKPHDVRLKRNSCQSSKRSADASLPPSAMFLRKSFQESILN